MRPTDAGLARWDALGLSDMAAALNAGWVARLIYDTEIRYTAP